MMNSAAFGGGDENRFPMCVNVSSLTPVGATFNGSLPSKKPDHGESNQSLYYRFTMQNRKQTKMYIERYFIECAHECDRCLL